MLLTLQMFLQKNNPQMGVFILRNSHVFFKCVE